MKKLIAILAVVSLLACLGGLNAFAATETVVLDDTKPVGTSDADVVINVKDGNDEIIEDDDVDATTKVYSVDVEWEAMTFVFKTAQTVDELEWDPETHRYTNLVGTWEDDTAVVTVTNHSNATVDVAVAFADDTVSTQKLGVTAAITGTDRELASAVGTAVDNAPSASYDVTVSGTPAQLTEFVVETVVVTLSK